LFLHTDVSVRACTSCPPLLITSKQKGCCVAELLETQTQRRCYKSHLGLQKDF